MSLRLAITFVALTILTSLSGCTTYRLGSGNELTFKSIYVKPAENNSFAPQAQAIVSAKIRDTLIRDGRVKLLTDEADADAILLVNLSDYSHTPAARRSVDTKEARSFELKLTAQISLYEQSNGSYHFRNRTVEENTNVHTNDPFRSNAGNSYQQAEYQAMPRLAHGLARKITDEVLSVW